MSTDDHALAPSRGTTRADGGSATARAEGSPPAARADGRRVDRRHTTARPGRAAMLALGLAALAPLAGGVAPSGAAAQEPCDEAAGSLGIQGMRCEGCSFRMDRSGIADARFRTEPEVTAVARGFTEGDRLRPGDRIVALDDALVTTRAGGQTLVDLRTGQRVRVRVRRDGQIRELDMVAGSACALRRAMDEGEVEVVKLDTRGDRRITPPRRRRPVEAPEPPRRAAPPGARSGLPGLPPLPPPPGPTGYLGFGYSCTECGLRDGEFFFSAPPVVQGVAEDGPAAASGLRRGDEIVAVDGLEITGEGAARLGAVEPGDTLTITFRRDGRRGTARLVAGEREVEPAPLLPAPGLESLPDLTSGRLRYEGELGDVRIEVRGGPARVTTVEGSNEIIIWTGQSMIRLKRGG